MRRIRQLPTIACPLGCGLICASNSPPSNPATRRALTFCITRPRLRCAPRSAAWWRCMCRCRSRGLSRQQQPSLGRVFDPAAPYLGQGRAGAGRSRISHADLLQDPVRAQAAFGLHRQLRTDREVQRSCHRCYRADRHERQAALPGLQRQSVPPAEGSRRECAARYRQVGSFSPSRF